MRARSLILFQVIALAGCVDLPPDHIPLVSHHSVYPNNVVPTWNKLQLGYKDHEHRSAGPPCDNEAVCEDELCLCITAGGDNGFYNPHVHGDTPKSIPGGLPGLYRKVQEMQDSGGFVHLILGTMPGAGDLQVRKLWEVRVDCYIMHSDPLYRWVTYLLLAVESYMLAVSCKSRLTKP